MRNISEYIHEARVQSGPVEIEYTPKNRMELIFAIKEVAKAQSRRKILNFNCIDTSAVSSMNYVFYIALCTMPAQLNKDFLVDQWDVSNVTNFTGTFNACKGFTGTGLENWKVSSKCESTEGMFENCFSFEDIDMSKWDMRGVIGANAMFLAAKNLRSVKFPELMPKLEELDQMLYHCKSLEYVRLPKKISARVKFTNKMLSYSGSKHNRLVVDNLNSITLKRENDMSVVTGCSEMFKDCGIEPEILREYVKVEVLSDKDMELLGIDTNKL